MKVVYIAVKCVIFICMLGVIFYQHNKLETEKWNRLALTDTLSRMRLENDQLLYEKQTYILNEKEMLDVINMSKNEISDLKRTLDANIVYINNISCTVRTDTVYIERKDDTFQLDERWLKLSGSIDDDKVTIHNIQIPLDFKSGFTDNGKGFVTVDNPYMRVNKIEGVVNKRKWDIRHSLQVGVGLTYGLVNRSLDIGPTLSYGITIRY